MSAELIGLVERSFQRVAGSRARRQASGSSGAAILGGKIVIVTVCRGVGGSLSVDLSRSADFDLGELDQMSVRRLHSRVKEFSRVKGISKLALRKPPSSGPLVPKADTIICEGALYLVDGLTVHQVPAATLAHWMRAHGIELVPQSGDRCWQYAAWMALYISIHGVPGTQC